MIDAATRIPLAVRVVPIQEHDTLSLRVLIIQARTHVAGHARLHKVVIAVVGEGRSRISSGDVDGAVRQTRRLASQMAGAPVTVLFGCVIHPSARQAAEQLGAMAIHSSRLLGPRHHPGRRRLHETLCSCSAG